MLKLSITCRLFLAICFALFTITPLVSQEVTIKDDTFKPLIGATLVLLPDSSVYVSGIEGKVVLTIREEQEAIISFVGYETRRGFHSPQ